MSIAESVNRVVIKEGAPIKKIHMMCHLTIAMYIVCISIISLSYINGFIIYDKSISAVAFTTTVHHLDRRRYREHIKLQTFDVATRHRQRIVPLLFMSSSSNDGSNKSEDNDNEELSMAIAKVRLEQSMKPAYLTSKPIKLNYKTSQRWIQKNWSPKSKKEFDDLVANGNLRTPYISKCPEEYYGERGEWISWDHYLLSNPDDDDDGDSSDSNNGKNCTNVMLKWQ